MGEVLSAECLMLCQILYIKQHVHSKIVFWHSRHIWCFDPVFEQYLVKKIRHLLTILTNGKILLAIYIDRKKFYRGSMQYWLQYHLYVLKFQHWGSTDFESDGRKSQWIPNIKMNAIDMRTKTSNACNMCRTVCLNSLNYDADLRCSAGLLNDNNLFTFFQKNFLHSLWLLAKNVLFNYVHHNTRLYYSW